MGVFDGFSRDGRSSPDEVTREELASALEADAWALVDVREIHEFDAGHVPGSVNMPLSSFQPSALPTEKPLVLICRSGVRSANALHAARAAGVAEIRHYRGGVIGWANGGGELV